MTNVFEVCDTPPYEWQPDEVREKQTTHLEHILKGEKNWWQKKEHIYKVVLKLFIEVILVQYISGVLENP